jgi:hypothetical protein
MEVSQKFKKMPSSKKAMKTIEEGRVSTPRGYVPSIKKFKARASPKPHRKSVSPRPKTIISPRGITPRVKSPRGISPRPFTAIPRVKSPVTPRLKKKVKTGNKTPQKTKIPSKPELRNTIVTMPAPKIIATAKPKTQKRVVLKKLALPKTKF